MPGQGRSKNVSKAESVDIADVGIADVGIAELVIEDVVIEPVIEEEVKVEEKPVVEETPKVVDTPKVAKALKVRYATGEVHNCGILKVRKVANAKSEVVTVINRGTQVKVDFEESSETFYKVTVGKTSGFSMKAYIKIVE